MMKMRNQQQQKGNLKRTRKNKRILQINISAPTTNPVITTPTTLVTNTPWTGYTVSRNFNLQPDTMMSAQGQVAGPFNINGFHFDMNVINVTTYLNNIEKWRVTNNTSIAHPFHIHDMHFYLLNVNGAVVPKYERGKKDVVLVLPNQYVEFITKFEDFANDSVPYMYHCHLLHHEDDGMMGSFRVLDTTATSLLELQKDDLVIYPNPAYTNLFIEFTSKDTPTEIKVLDILGKQVQTRIILNLNKALINVSDLRDGIYILKLTINNKIYFKKFIKQ